MHQEKGWRPKNVISYYEYHAKSYLYDSFDNHTHRLREVGERVIDNIHKWAYHSKRGFGAVGANQWPTC